MPKTTSRPTLDENELIARYFRPLAKTPGALSLLDDAAFLTPPAGHDVVVTADAIVAGVHFFPSDPPDTVARKALRVNLSDLAAKGAEPLGFVLTLGLPAARANWLKAFAGGLGKDADAFACPLLGGDTVKTSGPLFISITAFGAVPRGAMVQRRGAKPGDRILVTGTIGDAALGLALRRRRPSSRWRPDRSAAKYLMQRYLLPNPRNALAAALRRHAHAAIDISDGLVGDLGKLCLASGIGAELEVARVPLSRPAEAARGAEPALLATMLTGGDDFEIACAVPTERLDEFATAADQAKVAVTTVGHVVAGKGVRVIGPDGKPMHFKRTSFSHF